MRSQSMRMKSKTPFGMALFAILIAITTLMPWRVGAQEAGATKDSGRPVFKIIGRMIVKVYDPAAGELTERDSIGATVATDTDKWRMIMDSKKSPQSDSFFDGTDTYFYRPV